MCQHGRDAVYDEKGAEGGRDRARGRHLARAKLLCQDSGGKETAQGVCVLGDGSGGGCRLAERTVWEAQACLGIGQ